MLHVCRPGIHRQYGKHVVATLADGLDDVPDYARDLLGGRRSFGIDNSRSMLPGPPILHIRLEESQAWIRYHGCACCHGYIIRLHLFRLLDVDGSVLGRRELSATDFLRYFHHAFHVHLAWQIYGELG